MIDLSVEYAGLKLKNPIIVGSCGLTNNIESLLKLEKQGASAIVLKSIFEEQIIGNANFELSQLENNVDMNQYAETSEYLHSYLTEDSIRAYIALIEDAKRQLSIPIIASINCISSDEWTKFAKRIETAGADAIELNIFIHASDDTNIDIEATYIEIIEQVKKEVNIPITLKMSHLFTQLSKTIQNLSKTKIKGLVLFNRFYSPDFNLNTLSIEQSHKYSTAQDYVLPLHWIALNAKKVGCDLAASTGVHTADAAIKQILAGATAVQVVSAIYVNGPEVISNILQDIEAWMNEKGFTKISDFKGLLSANKRNQAAFERIQFMRYFSEIGEQ